jgi:hypothetical protein
MASELGKLSKAQSRSLLFRHVFGMIKLWLPRGLGLPAPLLVPSPIVTEVC